MIGGIKGDRKYEDRALKYKEVLVVEMEDIIGNDNPEVKTLN